MAGSTDSSQPRVSVVGDTIHISFSLVRKISAGIALGAALTVSNYPVYSFPLLVATCLQDEDKGCNPQVLPKGRTRALLQSPIYAGSDTFEDRFSVGNKLGPFGISLESLLPDWQRHLQGWAKDGSLALAAEEALGLVATPAALEVIIDQFKSGNFKALPPILLLSGSRLSGVKGAYASSTGTIYLNANWLKNASKQQVFSVLTEELGHHLDRVMNASDTPRDEGEYFARILANRSNGLAALEIQALRTQKDNGYLVASSQILQVEFALNYWWNDWGVNTPIGLGPQHYDLASNTLFVLESDYWDGNGPHGFSLVGRNPDNGNLVSSFRLDQNSPYNWGSAPGGYNAGISQIRNLPNGNWLIGGFFHPQPYNSRVFAEMRDGNGGLVWRTENVGGRYGMSHQIILSNDNNFAFVPADGTGDGVFASGIAKIRLSDGYIVDTVSQIAGGGANRNFFEGHNNTILVDASTSILVFDQDLVQVGEIARPHIPINPYLNDDITDIFKTSEGGYIIVGHRDVASLWDPSFRDSQIVFPFAAGYSSSSILNNLAQPDWLVDLDNQGGNVELSGAQYLPDGTIGLIGTTTGFGYSWGGHQATWLGGITESGSQTYNEFFADIRARNGFFVDQAGDIRTWEADGPSEKYGTYTIDISSTSSPPSGGGGTSGGGTSGSGGSGASTASVPGPLPLRNRSGVGTPQRELCPC